MAQPLSRRERARADTLRDIRSAARAVLVEHGVDGLALRAIAREVGLTAPALYRYFASREELVERVVADLYDELCDVMEAARDAVDPPRPGTQLLVTARAFRTWATTHPAEFGLLFGSAADGVVPEAEDGEGPAAEAGRRFGGVFATLFAAVYLRRPFPVPADDDLDPDYREQLREWCTELPVALPLGVMSVFLSCWVRLYGMVCMEVFGHLRFALADAGPLFEAEMHAVGERLGIADDWVPPGG
ncbi:MULTISPECIES: TetR/AcrR family transcriptional regulator [unclassified Geodermatophilus]